MSRLSGKHIVLGITGSIAAYKAAILVRLLVKSGADVQVIMTPAAKEFITPLTLSTLSGHTVISEFFNERTGDWNSHVDLGLWADYFVVAPATASTLSKMAYGQADNMLITSYLSTRGQCFVAPAMDLDMYAHPATQKSLEILRSRGVKVIDPAEGELASHLVGKGRMAEPQEIVDFLEKEIRQSNRLEGKKVLITSGPTYEKIDPVRFIGNYSTGKMGKALAESFSRAGAEVVFVTGPVHSLPEGKSIEVRRVESARDMLSVCRGYSEWYDVAIFCAAVADYRPRDMASEKIKREQEGDLTLHLEQNPDIAATLGKVKREGTLHVGFALETNASGADIVAKMRRKSLDMIVHNSLKDAGAGFGTETNKVTIYMKDGSFLEYGLKSKPEVAEDILNLVVQSLEI